jgi:Hypoxia induced protein conserved region
MHNRGQIMTDQPLFIVAALACLGVLAILAIGIGGFGQGGEFNRKNSNRMMRYRIYAQGLAVLLIVGFVWLRGTGGN